MADAGIKTNPLLFTKGKPTEKIWCYDLQDIKVGKKTPLLTGCFDDFFRLPPTRDDSDRNWTVTRDEIETRNYDVKAAKPNARADDDLWKPEDPLDLIKVKEASAAPAKLSSS